MCGRTDVFDSDINRVTLIKGETLGICSLVPNCITTKNPSVILQIAIVQLVKLGLVMLCVPIVAKVSRTT